ncbi:MAG: GyrI-like domain-containing protein [Bacteroidia bacterium]
MIKKAISLLSFVMVFASCSDADEVLSDKATKEDSAVFLPKVLEKGPNAVKEATELNDNKGIIGIYHVPEMLSLTILDSAEYSGIAKKLSANFRKLVEDADLSKAEIDGSGGVIYYNNDPENFIFECVVPIKEMPKKKPKHSQVVVLEEDKMIIYNYYGPYETLNLVYEEVRDYMKLNGLKQSGPMREFYIVDPAIEKDSTKWLTRVMVPVN